LYAAWYITSAFSLALVQSRVPQSLIHAGSGLALFHRASRPTSALAFLDVLRVVDHRDRTLEHVLGEVALVLGLQVHAPRHRELEGLARALEHLDGLGVVEALELRLDQRGQPLLAAGIDELLEEGEVVLPLVEHGGEDELEEVLGEVGVGGEIGERDLRLDHPELGEVAAGVRVLGAEGRAEGVDPAHRQAIGLDVELARDRQVGLLAEEVLVPVDGAGGRARRAGGVEGRDPEHLAGALGVAAGDDRRVDPEEAALVEEAVHRHRQGVAHPGHGADHVGARPQVRDLAQVLHGVALGLHRVGLGILDPADRDHLLGAQLDGLALALRGHDLAGDADRAAGRELLHDVGVAGQVGGDHRLQRLEARAVVDREERQPGLGVAAGADPALDDDAGADRDLAFQDGGDALLHADLACNTSAGDRERAPADRSVAPVRPPVPICGPVWGLAPLGQGI
jgi:hypothetical protein